MFLKPTISPSLPFSNKPHPAAIGPPLPHSSKNGAHKIEIGLGPGKLCECCSVSTSVQWYAWGSSNPATPPSQAPSRLCQNCWSYWKKYGDLDVSNKNGAASNASDDEAKNLTGGGSDGMSSRPNRIAAQGCGKVNIAYFIIKFLFSKFLFNLHHESAFRLAPHSIWVCKSSKLPVSHIII